MFIFVTIGYPQSSGLLPWIIVNKVSVFVKTTPTKEAKLLRKEIADHPERFPLAVGGNKPSELFYEIYEKKRLGRTIADDIFELVDASDNAPNQPGG